jgi:hypothetical protein
MSESSEINKQSWKETKKEYEIKDGHEVLTKVTKEATIKYFFDKDAWVLIFQAVSSFGIVFVIGYNIYALNRQNDFQLQQQYSLFELGIFTKAINDISITTSKPVNDTLYQNAVKEINQVIMPTTRLLKCDAVNSQIFQYYQLLSNEDFFSDLSDSLAVIKTINSEIFEIINAKSNFSSSQRLQFDIDISDIMSVKNRLSNLGKYWDGKLSILRNDKRMEGAAHHSNLIDKVNIYSDYSHNLTQDQTTTVKGLLQNKDSLYMYFDTTLSFLNEFSSSLSRDWKSIYEKIRSEFFYQSSIEEYNSMQKLQADININEFKEVVTHIERSYYERRLLLQDKIVNSMVQSNKLLKLK